MSDICLTEDEQDALRQVLAMLAVIGERGFDEPDRMVHITAHMWQDQLVRPAQRLRRVARAREYAALAATSTLNTSAKATPRSIPSKESADGTTAD